jgi:hypothetical protein
MRVLDAWTETNVTNPLHDAVTNGDSEACQAACDSKRAIRQKVLERVSGKRREVVLWPQWTQVDGRRENSTRKIN